jgi:hypothetical protein
MEEEREARFATLGETMVDAVSCGSGSHWIRNSQLGRSGARVIIPHPDLNIPFMVEQNEAHFAALGETMVDAVSCGSGSRWIRNSWLGKIRTSYPKYHSDPKLFIWKIF